MLEVLRYARESGTCIVLSGWGERAQWLRNVAVHPFVAYTIGTIRYAGVAERLNPAEAEQELRRYGAERPNSLRLAMRFTLGVDFRGSDAEFRHAATHLPMVRLRRQLTGKSTHTGPRRRISTTRAGRHDDCLRELGFGDREHRASLAGANVAGVR